MGKRGDRRRKKARETKRRKSLPYEGFTYGPLTVERHGRFLRYRLDSEHPQLDIFRAAVREQWADAPARYLELRGQLTQLLAPYDAFDVLAGLWLMNVPKNPDTYRESVDEGLAAACEVAAAALLDRDGRAGTQTLSFPDGGTLSRAQELVREMLEAGAMSVMHDGADGEAQPDEFAQIRVAARLHRLAVRGSSYDWQEEQTLRDLFDADRVRDDVAAAAGFSVSDALKLVDALDKLGLDRLEERAGKARASFDAMIRDLRNRRAGRPLEDPAHAGIVESLSTLREDEAERRLHALGVAWVGLAAGETMSFTAEELAESAGCDPDATTAFLRLFSVGFGGLDGAADVGEIELLRNIALVRDADANYLCFSQHNLLWGVRPQLEQALKSAGGQMFLRYERHRRRVVEERAVTALSKALRPDWTQRELSYETVEDGQAKRPEVDGLVRLDSVLFVIEAKGSSMRPSARRGAPAALRYWLRDEVSKAATQARRASRALLNPAGPPPVTDSRNTKVELDFSGVQDVFELVVVLEDLQAIGPSTWRLADAGLLPKDPVPLVVSLHELEVICDIVERPAELVHYFHRRRRMDDSRRAWAMDELDYFMHYLTRGLWWPDLPEGQTVAPEQLLSHTDELDAYYMFVRGLRTKRTERPGQRHHRDVRDLLDSLDSLTAPGRLAAAIAILDVDSKARRRVATGLRTLKRRSELDGKAHDLTLVFDDVGITVMTVPPWRAAELPEDLHTYCALKKYQQRASRWIGFGGYAGPPEPAQLAVVFDEPWEANEELDVLVGEMPSSGMTKGQFDGRVHARRLAKRERQQVKPR